MIQKSIIFYRNFFLFCYFYLEFLQWNNTNDALNVTMTSVFISLEAHLLKLIYMVIFVNNN